MDNSQPAHVPMRYISEPTLALFHQDHSRIRGVRGPVGSGKSSAMAMECWFRAEAQAPLTAGPHKGERRSVGAIIRNTYSQLLMTTVKTFSRWVPIRFCPIKGSAPLLGRLEYRLSDDTIVSADIWFLALDRAQDVEKIDSLDLTWWWINEAQHIPFLVFDRLRERLNRFPPMDWGGPSWTGGWMDTNAPSCRHWWYRLAECEQPAGMRFFAQPPAVLRRPNGAYVGNPRAENALHHKEGLKYWLSMIPGKTLEEIRVRLMNEYGSIFDGKPVFEELWSEERHISKLPLEVWKGYPLYLGWDFGRWMACVAAQIAPNGQVRVLREWTQEGGGLQHFVAQTVRPALWNEFSRMEILSYGDPAGQQRGQIDEVTCIGELGRLGVPTKPAPTNNITARIEAINGPMMRTMAHESGFLIDPRCAMLIDGFRGGYRYKPLASTNGQTVKDVPDKNEYSHAMDALSYVCLVLDPSISPRMRMAVAQPEVGGWGSYV